MSILRQIKPGFVDMFEKAVDFYIEGDWHNAQQNFATAQQLNFADGPTKFLMNYLEIQKNISPENWANARDIDEKQKPPDADEAEEDDSFDEL